MKKYMLKASIVILILAVAVITILVFINELERLKMSYFEDEEMGNLIIQYARIEDDEAIDRIKKRDEKDVKIEHIDEIKEMNIGYTGYYDTLLDITKCKNLEILVMGHERVGTEYGYFYRSREVPAPETSERVKQIEAELEIILQKCSKLKRLYVWNTEDNCNLESLEFLKYGTNLTMLSLNNHRRLDYSPILQCLNLKVLDLDGSDISELGEISKLSKLEWLSLDHTNIEEVGEIVKLKKLKTLYIKNTPLSKNKKEMALLRKTFPDLDIEQ